MVRFNSGRSVPRVAQGAGFFFKGMIRVMKQEGSVYLQTLTGCVIQPQNSAGGSTEGRCGGTSVDVLASELCMGCAGL